VVIETVWKKKREKVPSEDPCGDGTFKDWDRQEGGEWSVRAPRYCRGDNGEENRRGRKGVIAEKRRTLSAG